MILGYLLNLSDQNFNLIIYIMLKDHVLSAIRILLYLFFTVWTIEKIINIARIIFKIFFDIFIRHQLKNVFTPNVSWMEELIFGVFGL